MNLQKEKIKDRIADSAIFTIMVLFFLLISLNLYSQTPYPQFQNPSLEDVSGVNVTPWGYSKCTVGGPSSPDVQPGIWNVFLQPSNFFYVTSTLMPGLSKSMWFSRKMDVPYRSLADFFERMEKHHGLIGSADHISRTMKQKRRSCHIFYEPER